MQQANINQIKTPLCTPLSEAPLSRALMMSSALALGLMISVPAHAQSSIPDECEVDGTSTAMRPVYQCDGIITDPIVIDYPDIEDLTVNIGTATEAATVSGGVVIANSYYHSSATINIDNPNSVISSTGIAITLSEDINTLNSAGDINSGSTAILGGTNNLYGSDRFNITANNINADGNGITLNGENARTNIIITGDITTGGTAIESDDDGYYGGRFDIQAHNITAGDRGIVVRAYGVANPINVGSANITLTGDLLSEGTGISIVTGDIDINAVNITSNDDDAINVRGGGSYSNTDIVITGTAAGGRNGINAEYAEETNITVNNAYGENGSGIINDASYSNILVTGTVRGSENGISSRSYREFITSTGEITGGTGAGINAIESARLTIILNDGAIVSAASGDAIIDGTGSGSITVNSGAQIIGAVRLGEGSDSLTITDVQDLSAITLLDGGDDMDGADGYIDRLTISGSNGTLSISNWEEMSFTNSDLTFVDTTFGALESCGGATGLSGASSAANLTGCADADNFTIAGSSSVSGDINSAGGDDVLTLMTSGTLGDIDLGAGNDAVNYESGSFDSLSGGAGTDTFNLLGSGGNFAGSGISAFETLIVQEGIWSLGSLSGFNAVEFSQGSSVDLESDAALSGDLTNDGSLTLAGSGVGAATINGDFTQSSTGALTLGIADGGTADQLTVSGDVTLAGSLEITNPELALGTVTLIDGGSGLTGSFDSVNVGSDSGSASGILAGLNTQTLEYDRVNFDVLLVTGAGDVFSVDGLSTAQANTANALLLAAGANDASTGLGNLASLTSALTDINALTDTLDALRPQSALAGLNSAQNTQYVFQETLMDHASADEFHKDQDALALLSAPQAGRAASALTPQHKTLRGDDGQMRLWSAAAFRTTTLDGSSGADFEADGYDLTLGLSGIGNEYIRAGVAVGLSDIESESTLAAETTESQLFKLGAHISAPLALNPNGLSARLDGAASYFNGENDLSRTVNASQIDLSEAQSGAADIDGYSAQLRLTLEGSGANLWPVQPFVFIGADSTSQSELALGTGAAALNIDAVEAKRQSYGIGARFSQNIAESTRLRASAMAVQYTGDTQSNTLTRFGVGGDDAAFTLTSGTIESQFLLSGGLDHNFDNGLQFSVQALGQFGDLESYGGALKLSKRY